MPQTDLRIGTRTVAKDRGRLCQECWKRVVSEGYELEEGLEVVEDVKDIGTKMNPQRRDITRFSM
jgi:hypothetical protein